MEVELNKQKVCPNCGKEIEPDYKHCRFCGFELEEDEPNKIEISETLKKSRIYTVYGCLTTGIIVTILLIILTVTLGEFTTGAIIGLIVVWVFFFIVTIPSLLVYKQPSKIRTFSISDKRIRIIIPNKPMFQINWDQIEAIKVKRRVTGRSRYSMSMHVYNNYSFIIIDGSQRDFTIEITRDFRKKTCKKIRSLIEQYVNKMNKGYEFKRSFWS